jgi:hypothetical protein
MNLRTSLAGSLRGYAAPGARLALKQRAADNDTLASDHEHRGTSLESVAPVLGLYYRALSGRNAALLPFGNRYDPEQYPDTHTTIRLPDRIARYFSDSGNFNWYKATLTHRAAHYDGGTFGFGFLRPATHFRSLRPASLDEVEHYGEESDLELFFSLFAQRQFSITIFTVMEDLRLDEWVKRRYRGFSRGYQKIQHSALHDRPEIDGMGPRNALAEAMLRISLGAEPEFTLPALLHEPLRQMAQLMRPLALPDARVEDSAEAALRAYCLLAGLPNMQADYGPATPVDVTLATPERAWPTIWPEPEQTRLEGDDVLQTVIAPVSYRDQLGSRFANYRGTGPLDQQSIYRFTLKIAVTRPPQVPEVG